MLRSLCRARIAGRVMHDRQSREWVFPALSRSGHVEEIKGTSWINGKKGERRKIVRLTKVGHSLRHSYRTLCAAAGLDRLRTTLLTIQNELIRGRRRQFLPGPSHRQSCQVEDVSGVAAHGLSDERNAAPSDILRAPKTRTTHNRSSRATRGISPKGFSGLSERNAQLSLQTKRPLFSRMLQKCRDWRRYALTETLDRW
jgi:hypothetical protein